MFPILFSIGNFDIMTYYVITFLGILAGLLILYLNTKNFSYKKKIKIIIFTMLIFVFFIAGARFGYIVECLILSKKSCSFGLIGPTSLLWGMFFAVICAPFLAKLFNLIVWEIGDLYALSISIGGFFVRIGCFFNGCCFGIPCSENFIFGTFFPYTSYPGKIFENVPIHPTQLYLSFTWLFIFILLNLYKKRQKFYGELFFIMSFLFSFSNFFIEFLRYHEINRFPSLNQILSIIILLLSIITYIFFAKFKFYRIKTTNENLQKN